MPGKLPPALPVLYFLWEIAREELTRRKFIVNFVRRTTKEETHYQTHLSKRIEKRQHFWVSPKNLQKTFSPTLIPTCKHTTGKTNHRSFLAAEWQWQSQLWVDGKSICELMGREIQGVNNNSHWWRMIGDFARFPTGGGNLKKLWCNEKFWPTIRVPPSHIPQLLPRFATPAV